MSFFSAIGDLFTGGQAKHQMQGEQNILNNAYSFNSSRPIYADMLNQLMSNPSEMVTKMPGYQFGMDQALQGTSRQMASQGLMGSGTAAQALTDTGQKFASSEFDKLFMMLSQLSGANFNPSDFFKGQQAVDQGTQNAEGQMLGSLGDIGSSLVSLFSF